MVERFVPREQFIATKDIGTGWDRSLLAPESATAQKRFNAVLNIAQNGAQTLEVLGMNVNPDHWQSWYQVFKEVRNLVGHDIMHKKTTENHLKETIGPIGAAAKSDADDKMWAITEFGGEMRPAIVYTWQQFTDMGINPMSLLSANSRVSKNEKSGKVSTGALSRAKLLMYAFGKKEVTGSELLKATSLGSAALQVHTDVLADAGFITKRSADVNSGDAVAEYTITDVGISIENWNPRKLTRHGPIAKWVPFVQQAAFALQEEETPITTTTLNKKIDEMHPELALRKDDVGPTITRMLNYGLMKNKGFAGTDRMFVTLTDLGEEVAEKILFPLRQWSFDPTSEPHITTIAENLKEHPDMYQDLYKEVAEVYKETSPHKNSTPEEKADKVLHSILQNPREMTQAQLARSLGISKQSVQRALGRLKQRNLIQSVEIDGRIYYMPVVSENLNDE